MNKIKPVAREPLNKPCYPVLPQASQEGLSAK